MDPTRQVPTQRSSILDLVFTDDPNSIDYIEHYPPLGSSDHECLVFDFKCYTVLPSCEETPRRYNYWKGNYLAMCEELDNIDWDDLLQHDSIETNWDLFKNLMLSLLDKYVPKVVKKVNTNKPPWWSSRLSKAVRDKQYLYSHFKFTKSPLDYSKYTSQRNHVKYLIRSAKVKHDELMMQRFKSNPKMLYSYVRSKSKVRSRIG